LRRVSREAVSKPARLRRVLRDRLLLALRTCWPDQPDLVALDDKTSRRSHDLGRGRAALHLVSAFAINERLVLGQEAVGEASC
jgi:hypothetical protein